MSGRLVCRECGLVPAACDCPESLRRPYRLKVERDPTNVIPRPVLLVPRDPERV